MSDWLAVAVWWLVFGATHIGMSSNALRPRLVGVLGDKPFLALYSLVSLATFVALVRSYLASQAGRHHFMSAGSLSALGIVALLISGLAFAVVLASLAQPSATSMSPGSRKRAYGLIRITRHPMDMFLGLWALAHLLVNQSPAALVFFGGFPVFALLADAHQDARKRAAGGLEEFFAETSLLPFAAIAAGRNRLVLAELPWIALAIGAAVSAGIFLAHPWMFS